jgi:hypothetical protein
MSAFGTKRTSSGFFKRLNFWNCCRPSFGLGTLLPEWATPLELNLPKNIAVEWSQDGDQRHNHGGGLMKKVLIATALLFTALPFTFDGVTPVVSKAHAIIGRPGTPMSFAGVHRRAVRRTFGVGANLGYRGFYHRHYGAFAYRRHVAFHRPFIRRPVVAAAAVGAGWGGGWGGWGWNRPLYSAAPGWGGGWGGWGWNRPWGW